MKRKILIFITMGIGMGCARVSVQAPKEPIKMDISMRLDVYQHVEKDIDAIENMVSGGGKPESKAAPGLLGIFVKEAFADDGLSPQVEEAALRRRDRRSQLEALEAQGILGENMSGWVVIRSSAQADTSTQRLVDAENADRRIIYEEVARKNGTAIDEVQILYAKRLQDDAPSGTPIESINADGSYEWVIKP